MVVKWTKIYKNLTEIYQKRRYRQHRIGHTEPKNIIMSKEQKTTEFVVFCIENTATRLKKEGYDVFRELAKTNGIEICILSQDVVERCLTFVGSQRLDGYGAE